MSLLLDGKKEKSKETKLNKINIMFHNDLKQRDKINKQDFNIFHVTQGAITTSFLLFHNLDKKRMNEGNRINILSF